jgi:branched-chain amino acid transport system permease protein
MTTDIARTRFLNQVLPIAIIALVAIFIPLVFTRGIVNEASVVLVAIVATLALQILTGFAGQLSLGSAALMAVGAFTVGMTNQAVPGIPFFVLILWAGFVGAIVGFLVGLPALRVRGLYLIIATLALHYIVIFMLQQIQQDGPGVVGYIVFRPDLLADDTSWYYLMLVVALVITLITAGFKVSETGRAWQMMAHNENAAIAIGINVRNMKLKAFVISSFVTSLLGGLLAYTIGVVTYETFTLGLAISYIAAMIIAGIGSTAATWLGAAFVVWIPLWVNRFLGTFGDAQNASLNAQVGVLIFGAAIVLFMMFLPGGLNAVIVSIVGWIRGRVADRGKTKEVVARG